MKATREDLFSISDPALKKEKNIAAGVIAPCTLRQKTRWIYTCAILTQNKWQHVTGHLTDSSQAVQETVHEPVDGGALYQGSDALYDHSGEQQRFSAKPARWWRKNGVSENTRSCWEQKTLAVIYGQIRRWYNIWLQDSFNTQIQPVQPVQTVSSAHILIYLTFWIHMVEHSLMAKRETKRK